MFDWKMWGTAALLAVNVGLGGRYGLGEPRAAGADSPAALPPDEIRCTDGACSLGACATQKLFTDPATARLLRVVPNLVDGQPHGFRIQGLRADSWPAQLGLRNGDVATRINGQELTDPQSALTIYMSLKDAAELTLTLQRGDQLLTRQLQLDHRPLKDGECPSAAAQSPPSAASAPPSTPPIAPAPSSQELLRSLAKDIHCKANHCILGSGVVDRMFDDTQLLHTGRLVPVIEKGETVAFQVFAIPAGSLWALLGFRNGDIVRSVNQFSMTGPDRALQAYSVLRSAPELRVVLTRKGAPLTLTFTKKP